MSETIKIVPTEQLVAGPPTPGMSRASAIATETEWMGEVRTERGTASGWHHHGEHTTYGRVLEGSVRVEFGPGGATSL